MPVILTPEQRDFVCTLNRGTRTKHKQTGGGVAGTGKTTTIRELKRLNPKAAVCAFTGKAAHVLRRKGIPASTIHSLIYKTEEIERIDSNGKRWKETVFVLKAPWKIEAPLFIVDEASMVTKKLHDDLLSFNRPVIFVGDHGQLPPVGDDFNLMECPDIRLETVHRNAGEIAHFANFIREGDAPVDWSRHPLCSGAAVRFFQLHELVELADEPDADQMICAFNKTRIWLNKFARECLGYTENRPVVGDRVMCLQNNVVDYGIFNGMQGTIAALWPNDEMVFDVGDREIRVPFLPEQFNNPERPKFSRSKRMPFDYCYCVTAHKAQGDEWSSVMVFEEKCPGWEHTRWAYTAASRAKKQLTWIPG